MFSGLVPLEQFAFEPGREATIRYLLKHKIGIAVRERPPSNAQEMETAKEYDEAAAQSIQLTDRLTAVQANLPNRRCRLKYSTRASADRIVYRKLVDRQFDIIE